jgi:CheY-like chemotaxis protein
MMNAHINPLKHILVVDDEPDVWHSVQLLLQDDGYIVDGAISGAEALSVYKPGEFGMIFADYLMPDMKGDQLAATLKGLSPRQPVVMVTAFLEKFLSSKHRLSGVDSILCKPFDVEDLRTAINRYARV